LERVGSEDLCYKADDQTRPEAEHETSVTFPSFSSINSLGWIENDLETCFGEHVHAGYNESGLEDG
jgi:hypothetical protein